MVSGGGICLYRRGLRTATVPDRCGIPSLNELTEIAVIVIKGRAAPGVPERAVVLAAA